MDVYTKYVYESPQLISPTKAITATDIWFSRLKHRGLVKMGVGNVLAYDLASRIVTRNFRDFEIFLKNDQSMSDGTLINAEVAIRSLSGNIKSIKKLSAKSFMITLDKADLNFKKKLASHLYLIHNPLKPEVSSGHYRFDKKRNEFEYLGEDSGYPRVVRYKKILSESEVDKAEDKFDTALVPPGPIKNSEKAFQYKVVETWGMILKLKGKFENPKVRKCFDDSLDRDLLVAEALEGHTAVTNFVGENKIEKCGFDEKFTIDIPVEIGDIAQKFCESIQRTHNVECNFISFDQLLTNLKTGKFDASLLSLTVDQPYIESISDYLVGNESFSILNKNVPIPKFLKDARGVDYIKALSKFFEGGSYFISLSKPVRTVLASDKEKYIPSMISPGHDYLENLKR
jgi:hypothetical protein